MKKDRKTNESRGITLIALIVTIIVLLILSGISIAMLTGQNGILNRAEKANSETKKTEIIAKLDILEKQLLNEGNITKQDLRIILDNYFTGVPAELPESVAELEALELTSKEGKYKVTVGEIYKGTFSQGTGGTNGLEKGKKDRKLMLQLQHELWWIPVNDYSKFHLIEGYYDGALDEMLSQETNPSREAGDTLNIAGSPMTKNSTEGTEESVAMYNSVKVNHGFYIARFEAGIEGVIDNYNLSSENEKVADGKTKPLSQKGVGVWNNIAWEGIKSDDLPEDYTANGAVKVARSMYTKSEACGVTSTLCYGVQWDAVMNFIDPKYETGECNTTTSFVANSQGKGNYKENIETTGYYVEKNIYDLAGNVREWTMEVCLTEQQVIRGGGFFNDRDWYYAASVRDTNLPFDAIDSTGFRVALYV